MSEPRHEARDPSGAMPAEFETATDAQERVQPRCDAGCQKFF